MRCRCVRCGKFFKDNFQGYCESCGCLVVDEIEGVIRPMIRRETVTYRVDLNYRDYMSPEEISRLPEPRGIFYIDIVEEGPINRAYLYNDHYKLRIYVERADADENEDIFSKVMTTLKKNFKSYAELFIKTADQITIAWNDMVLELEDEI